MIFVTVGTHEQPFDRLLDCVDRLKEAGEIEEDVFMQTGYSTYEPRFCRWERLIPYQEMVDNVRQARIVITHGGPASFLLPLQYGKIPVVVPRRHSFGEHVNDHQVEFVKAVSVRQENILPVWDIGTLGDTIRSYDVLVSHMKNAACSNNERFNRKFTEIVKEIMG